MLTILIQGVTYPGRLRYSQTCRSITIAPRLRWHQTQSPLIIDRGPSQNIVYVNNDWSNLESTIQWLINNPEKAERIANNTVKTFRDWYLTPAFETCYWRRLFRRWKDVTDDLKELEIGERGTAFENFVLMRAVEWKLTA